MHDTKESQSIEDKIIALLEELSTANIEQDKDSDPVIREVLAKMWDDTKCYNTKKLNEHLNDLLQKIPEGRQDKLALVHTILNEKYADESIEVSEICNHFIKNRKGRPFRSAATFVGSVLFPLEFITKDVFLCFKALNDGLSFIVPALKLMSKYLPWVAGASFVLEGLCMLADDAQEGNTDKSRKIEACLYLLGGTACIALAVLAPYSYVALLVTVWGISVGIYAARSMIALMGNYQAKNTLLAKYSELQAVNVISFKDVDGKIEGSNLSESQKKYLKARVAKLKESKKEEGIEGGEENCTLEELEKILDPYQGGLHTIKNNSVRTNAYLVFSFACAAIGCYAPEAAFIPATVGYVVSTFAVVAGRISSYFSNSSIREAQKNPFVTSEEVEQGYHGVSGSPESTELAGPEPTELAGPESTELAVPEPAELAGPEPTELAGPEPTELAVPTELAAQEPGSADMQRKEELKGLHDKIKEEILRRGQKKQLVNGRVEIRSGHETVEMLHTKVSELITNNTEKSHPGNMEKLNKMLQASKNQQKLDIEDLHKILDSNSRESQRFSEHDAGLDLSSGPS